MKILLSILLNHVINFALFVSASPGLLGTNARSGQVSGNMQNDGGIAFGFPSDNASISFDFSNKDKTVLKGDALEVLICIASFIYQILILFEYYR